MIDFLSVVLVRLRNSSYSIFSKEMRNYWTGLPVAFSESEEGLLCCAIDTIEGEIPEELEFMVLNESIMNRPANFSAIRVTSVLDLSKTLVETIGQRYIQSTKSCPKSSSSV